MTYELLKASPFTTNNVRIRPDNTKFFVSWPDYLIFLQKNEKKFLSPLFAVTAEGGEQI